MVAHACNTSPGESDAGRLPGVLNQIELQSETMPKNNQPENNVSFLPKMYCVEDHFEV